jgi:hypothetical protein
MKNAHLRFGRLCYTKVLKNTTSHFKIPLDRFIGEPLENQSLLKAHLISVAGGGTQIAAVSAGIANREWFTVEFPDGSTFRVTLGANAQLYRGSVSVEGSKHPLRHLVAVSEELNQIGTGKMTERVILLDDSPEFVWKFIAQVHGVPGMDEWAGWFVAELKRLKSIEPLPGIGCSPVLVKGTKGMFMNCISRGLRAGKLQFPQNNGPVHWGRLSLAQLLTPEMM